MDSYINHKVFRLSIIMYSLFLPFTPMSALSAGEKIQENRIPLQESENERYANQARNKQAILDAEAGVIAQNIHKMSNILSSSPSQLTEQAKSYALGKINGAISTETQKWLSRFGTGRINLSIDKKGKLDSSALDLLLPLYDNKADWLFFSQVGYRRHDSRNTLNLGLGGRYFTPDWMYGLNTFFDNDFTGQHQRLGVGGEIWTDYVKLSANTYWRVSKWRDSPKELDYEERPANGYDINGEFFLPAYPNLGGKLSYEQYFGDNVALFNRKTRQKNPNLARIGLNYTPIPLMTMGVDYKFGSSGHSEGLFLANLNYHFGIPFADQISPSHVAAMRTLMGSRYDLVTRNNNIVLDYRKKPVFSLVLPNTLNGYSTQHVQITPNITAEDKLKKLSWQANEEFRKNGGTIIPHGKSVELDLPKYSVKGINSYTLSATSEITGSNKPMTSYMNVVVEPFAIKEQSIKPSGTGPVISNGKPAYDLAATITYGNKNNPPITNQAIPKVQWSLEPADKHATLVWDSAGMTNDAGQLTATLSSTQPLDPKTKIYLSMDEQPKLEIKGDKPLNFTNLGDAILAKNFVFEQKAPYEAMEHKPITVTAAVFDLNGNPINKKIDMNLQWSVEPTDIPGLSVKPAPGYENSSDQDGNIKAIVTSTQSAKGVKVGVLINEQRQSFSEPFDFVTPKSLKFAFGVISQSPTGPLTANGKERYTYKVPVIDVDSKLPLKNQSLGKLAVELLSAEQQNYVFPDKTKIEFPANPITDAEGYVTLSMTSQVAMDGLYFTLSPDPSSGNEADSIQSEPVNFDPIPVPVGIFMGTKVSNNKKYIQEQGRPYNVHGDLVIQLTQDGKNNLFTDYNFPDGDGNIISPVTFKSSNPKLVSVDTDPSGNGNITFSEKHFSNESWPVTVTLIKKTDQGIKYGYYYTFNPRKYILFADNEPTVDLNMADICPQVQWNQNRLNGQIAHDPNVFDIGATPQTTTPTSLSYEYDKEHFPDFGLQHLSQNIVGTTILRTFIPGDKSTQYTKVMYGYDYLTRKGKKATEYASKQPSIPMCVIRVDGYGEIP
ncbi:inverse autotransporter beta domain-containing protein [Xenorhabdus griffiniae]|uniref:Inverse autotransporter beta domain-containing protein n=1 Tax=Xenorhabdus griffiniae TaxID=351672 RepID=A0ABY9XGY9_9GAMM|nr:inverse autotransporter beta domain-containing protein [Xenorhabdus griffiniae]MBD1226714.1 inverse autotransporter beta domain-containing protein [Xenorhabdus griffiniae]MBE8586875.1 inverse autotransporter beta domain-containing protein [Xenorhabdus griffiniae]WMV72201.1 inverse autotransporter beta domain-containing protein [Xenorhabdus griffiniae]WNH01879.1 inverse autotransporter beta domain-containing protein [Xenorhabdus griffiniae]